MVRGKIAGQEIQFKVDTGSQANLLPLTLFNRIAHASTPRKSAAVFSAYNGSTIKHVGVATEDLEKNEAQHSVSFFIVKKGRQAILGLKTCQQFGLVLVTVDAVKVGDGQTKLQLAFPDLFSGTGCVRRPYKMVLREDAVPVVQPARRVPIALKGRLRQELQRMEKASIIVKVDEPTEWVSPLVVVHKKNGTLRICMDPRAVNRSIKREHYPIPSREDIESELAGAQYFSRLDANAGFHQIPLDEATSRICTFATPFGRYRFLRLPFGISSASEVFQKTLTEMFEGLPGVRVYVDDVLIWGDSKEEHDERVMAVLRRAQEEGLTFNPAKCVFGTTQVAFLGDVIGRDGIRPDPDLIESVRAMPAPKDKQGVRRLLGVVNYFRKYLPALSDKTVLLRSLFVPGRDLLLADLLSRAALPTGEGDQVEDVDVHTTQVVTSIISKATMLRLQKETLEDPLLSRTMKQMEDGMAIDGVLKPYAEELSVVNGVPTPNRPWHLVGIDLFTFAGEHYVVVFDAHSNFPDVEKLGGATAAEVIDKISAIFSRYGIPNQVCTDNGPQFASREFASFVRRYDFEHITSSPEFPRSNGLAEKGVQIVKRILKKTHESRGDVWLGLLAYRSSPLDSGHSPGEILQGRRLHATLPEYNVDGGIPVWKQRQSSRGRPLPPLEARNVVRIKHGSWSRRAKVVRETAPRSYVVRTEDHGLLRRNRQHLLRTDENFNDTVSPEGNPNPDEVQ
nr:uncharacterized protein K02A2.6-like [Rhipicephalus microplus]